MQNDRLKAQLLAQILTEGRGAAEVLIDYLQEKGENVDSVCPRKLTNIAINNGLQYAAMYLQGDPLPWEGRRTLHRHFFDKLEELRGGGMGQH